MIVDVIVCVGSEETGPDRTDLKHKKTGMKITDNIAAVTALSSFFQKHFRLNPSTVIF